MSSTLDANSLIPESNLPLTSASPTDELRAVRGGKSVRVPIGSLPPSAAVQEQIDQLRQIASGSPIPYKLFSHLPSTEPTDDNQRLVRVTDDDPDKNGTYAWFVGGSGWEKVPDELGDLSGRVTDVDVKLRSKIGLPFDDWSEDQVGVPYDELTSGNTAGSGPRGPAEAASVTARLYQVWARIGGSSPTTTVIRFALDGGVIYEREVPCVLGNNLWTQEDLGDFVVPAGAIMSIGQNSDGTGRVQTRSSGGGLVWTITGASVATEPSTSQPLCGFKVQGFEDTVASRIAAETARADAADVAIKAKLGVDFSDGSTDELGPSALVAGTVNPNDAPRGPGQPTTVSGYLTRLEAYMRSGPQTVLRTHVPDGNGGYKIGKKIVLDCTAHAFNTWVQGVDYEPFIVQAGSYISLGPADGGSTGKAGAISSSLGDSIAWTGNAPGDASVPTESTAQSQIKATIVGFAESVQDQIDTVRIRAERVPEISWSSVVNGPVPLVETNFTGTTVPGDWTISDEWSVNDGLHASGDGGWQEKALLMPVGSAASRKITRARVRFNEDSKAGLIFESTGFGKSSNGTAMVVNCEDGQLEMYALSPTSDPSSPRRTQAIGFPIVDGRDYMLEARKVRMKNIFTLTDTVTGDSVTIDAEQGVGSSTGRSWGRAGMVFLGGDVTVLRFQHEIDAPYALHALIVGDSNTEGSALGVDYDRGWGYQIEDARGDKKVLVAARGGEGVNSCFARLQTDLLKFRPRYVVVSEGGNDSNIGAWRTGMRNIISLIQSVGATPVLCTIVPHPEAAEKTAIQNDNIKSRYFGDFPVIDFASAVSYGHDGETWNEAMVNGDDTRHANAVGQDAMFAQALRDAPFLMD